jgi:hypothetical protein
MKDIITLRGSQQVRSYTNHIGTDIVASQGTGTNIITGNVQVYGLYRVRQGNLPLTPLQNI